MWMGKTEDLILYEDKEILVCRKPAGLGVQSAGVGKADMESCLKNYLAEKTPGKVPFLGIIHRLDQPVEGVLVFAKTPEAAKELNRQLTENRMGKHYLAVTEGTPPAEEGVLEDWLKKDGKTNTSFLTAPGTKGGKRAELFYKVAKHIPGEDGGRDQYLLAVTLKTGRHHQIRVQMAHAGMPLVGDRKYNPQEKSGVSLGLCACALDFFHPRRGEKMHFSVEPEGSAFKRFGKDGEE